MMGGWLLGANGVAMVLGWLAIVALLHPHLHRGMGPWWAPFTLWVVHAACYLTAVMAARVFFGYVGPAVLTTSWGFAVFIHAFVAVLGGALVTRHYTGQF